MSEQILLVGGAAFLASLISGLGGFGGAFIVILVVTPIVGPKAVIPLISIFAVCGNVSRIYIYRHTIDWQLAIKFTLASVPGVYAGARFLAWVPEQVLLAVLGSVLIVAIPLRRYLKRTKFQPGMRTIVTIGIVFGLVSGTAAGSGMFVIAMLSSIGMTGPMLLGTDAAIGIVNAILRAGTFASLGLLTWDLVILGALMGVMTLPGSWVASRIMLAIGDRLHSILIEVIIACGGLWFLAEAYMYSGNAP